MPVEVVISAEAALDIVQVYSWYEEPRPGLGEEFVNSVEAALHRICREPERYPVVFSVFRGSLIRRFLPGRLASRIQLGEGGSRRTELLRTTGLHHEYGLESEAA
jgi:hypothetical protein